MLGFILLGVVGVVLIVIFILSDQRENRNRLAAKFQKGAHIARSERNLAEASEIGSRHTLELAPQRLEEQRQLELLGHRNAEFAYRNEELAHENTRVVLNEATRRMISPPTYESIVQKEEFNRLDFEKKRAEFLEAARIAMLTKAMPDLPKLVELNSAMEALHKQIRTIQGDKSLSTSSRKQMVEELNADIEALQEWKREIRGRLIQTDNQQRALGSSDEDADI